VSVRTRWVTSIDGLRALGHSYDAMVLSAGDAGLFYQLGWLERAWPYYRARLGGSICFLIAEHHNQPVALAPLVFRTKGWAHARQRVLGFLGGTWDELDNWMPAILVATGDPNERHSIMTTLAETIARQPWDLLDLRFVRDSCSSLEALRARFPKFRAAPHRLTTPRARIEGGWAPYWAGRSRRLLRMIERGRTRAADDRLPLVHEVTTTVPIERRREAGTLHLARQRQLRAAGRARSSPFEDAGAEQVLWSLIDWAAAHGQLRAHWLRLGDRTAAYALALHHAGTTFAYFNAIDPAAERYHPGTLLLAGMIEREVSEHGARVVDMMLGANLVKSLFATEELANTQLTVVNPGRLRSKISDLWVRAARSVARRVRR
jgi:Acetyltransferase (GNAT) domain